MILMAFSFSPFLFLNVRAAEWDVVLDIPRLSDSVPPEARDILEDADPLKTPDDSLWERLRDRFREEWTEDLPETLRTGGMLLVIALLVSLASSLCTGGQGERLVVMAGIAAVGVCVLGDFHSYLHEELSSLESLSDFSRALLPTLTAAGAAGGALTSGAAKYAATVFAMDLLIRAAQAVISPLICAVAALSVANAALEHPTLSAAARLARTFCTSLMVVIAFAFTLWISITGILTGTADAMTTRAAKTAVSAALPVVGSVISDAASSLAAAAGTICNTVGIFGMVTVLAVCIGPFVRLLLRYLIFKLAGVAAECITDKRLSSLISSLGDCFGLILALNGCGALMLFVSVYSMMRATT